METKDVIITVDGKHLDRIEQVADDLRKSGFIVKDVHKIIGIITGKVTTTMRPKIANIDGIVTVEEKQNAKVPPPDSEIQ
ncbi:hypothetical protein [Paenibacillus pinihumi]|uniref:hypothetical protein n=1 Tax=Paenibacillus pinihumi TaxID=669462 RepID=UPI00048BF7EB|nr:hypothetical protein [Paenibacillus pinihumi]